jgi:1,4-dihydroxy-2-naphthoyl-CoA synthase
MGPGAPNTNEQEDVSRRAIWLRDHILEFQNAISAIEKCPQPVIGAAHGVSFGLAIDILCACDIRYAASNARFSIKVSRNFTTSDQDSYAHVALHDRRLMLVSPQILELSRELGR